MSEHRPSHHDSVARWQTYADYLEAEIARLRESCKLVTDDAYRSKCIYEARSADVARLQEAITAHRERWTSVNSGDIRMNARPADLALWDALDGKDT